MKLKYTMEIVDIGGSLTAIPVNGDDSFHGILHVNDTACSILKLLKSEVSEEEIVTALEKEYDASASDILRSVQKIVGILRENGLLNE